MSYYSKADIPQLIAAFEAAKLIVIRADSTYFLCHALGMIASVEIPRHIVNKAKALVVTAIENSVTLESYFEHDRRCAETFAGRQRMRARWCDKIISDLKRYAK